MKIKILGTGCIGCKNLYNTVVNTVNEMQIEATVTKEEDLMKIMEYNVMQLPALVIDEEVITTGKKLSSQEVKEILKNKL